MYLDVQLYSINSFDNRENTMNKTSYVHVPYLRVESLRTHGDIKNNHKLCSTALICKSNTGSTGEM